MSPYPLPRMRRNRKSPWIRELVAETKLDINDLVLPIFIKEGKNIKEPVASMPSVYRYSLDEALKIVKSAYSLGIPAIALFPSIDKKFKTEDAEESYNRDNLICRAIKSIKDKIPGIGIICDVALDPYTISGHDGILIDNYVANDETINILVKQALCQAESGCDIVAPSDMMDGRIFAIRGALDQEGFKNTAILSYSAKYASKFYGPFRDAVGSRSSNSECDKKNYQMDYRNSKEAIRQIEHDIKQGADMVMVKPGMPYLDVIKTASETFSVPLFAYQVSGEYAMLKWASDNGCFSFIDVLCESLIAFKRAGANGIFTYGAIEIAQFLQK